MNETNNILFDSRYYNLLTEDPSEIHHCEYTAFIRRAFDQNIITKKELHFLTP